MTVNARAPCLPSLLLTTAIPKSAQVYPQLYICTMRISCSQHISSTHLLASDIWPERKESGDFPLFLKLRGLFDRILQEVSSQTEATNNQIKSKKRARSPTHTHNAKKRRLTPNGEASVTRTDNHDVPFPLSASPTVSQSLPGQEILPVWRHTFAMRYTTDSDDAVPADFLGVLETLRDSVSEPTTIDVGYSQIFDFENKLTAVWERQYRLEGCQDWFILPLSENGQDYVAVLESCYELQHIHKVNIQANMKVVILPGAFCDVDNQELPFELQLEVVVSLCLPSLFEPLSRKLPKKRAAFIEGCQSRLYHFLYGQPSGQNLDNIDIPYFYSILTSAPPMRSRLADDAMQPDALLPSLLPFQRRSVAWLLRREGKDVMSDGAIVSSSDDAEYSFWDEIQEGNHTFYYNRLSRMLYLEKPVVKKAFGGILAEEPGLGKTLETLSLILLNPAPEDRNPSMIRWDPEARLAVRAVRVQISCSVFSALADDDL